MDPSLLGSTQVCVVAHGELSGSLVLTCRAEGELWLRDLGKMQSIPPVSLLPEWHDCHHPLSSMKCHPWAEYHACFVLTPSVSSIPPHNACRSFVLVGFAKPQNLINQQHSSPLLVLSPSLLTDVVALLLTTSPRMTTSPYLPNPLPAAPEQTSSAARRSTAPTWPP